MLVSRIATQRCELDAGVGFARTHSQAYSDFAREQNVPKLGEVCLEISALYRDGRTALIRERFAVESLTGASEADVKEAMLSEVPRANQLHKITVTQLLHPAETFVLNWLKADATGLPQAEYYFSN
mmetsp:Transcript_32479/g.52611  ORF Transcript_32479/g.52611 Transcript_32479/m.52611 type:complete len:126 (-) Transcript_32479:381-758(-)|eukprot:CAMPEP_0184657386 /NCGR_PEP_ID=MMETSP0308-20130426/19154_1 /TAXON_ID=38269 /ORGANISM="Gloeochaete witrockiana, Strain SAG 46.84" /LENGTH=125 /DNA_ID=CAMNT_0027095155 /DNA_START=140 /DNA_END=517 /DNA_ORIENTATION=-